MDSDELTQIHASIAADWRNRLKKYNTSGVEKLASKYKNGDKCLCVGLKRGSFNFCFEVVFDDGTRWAVRFPIPGNVIYPQEKIRREVDVMKFMKENTSIPVPEIIASGMAVDNHDPKIGTFIIEEWIDGVPLSTVMEQLPRPSWGPVLRKDITNEELSTIYRQIAKILLELSRYSFDKIGAPSSVKREDGTTSWLITYAPMTQKMNEIESSGYVRMDGHLSEPFESVTEYFNNLVDQNFVHLRDQRNSVDNIDDARRKYILRRQMKSLVPSFIFEKYNTGPFKLVCDDFRPGNILVKKDTLEIVAVVDWEWTYAGPYQFLFSPPSWLILERPTSWTSSSEARYHEKFQLFLECLEEEETLIVKGMNEVIPSDQKMSILMRQSMEEGKLWYNELIRESFNFDEEVLWPNIESLVEKAGFSRLGNLDGDEDEIEVFVSRKMEDLNQYKLDLRELEESKRSKVEERNIIKSLK
ncbi:kinase-like domain-containing protein [Xylogone sp. PMI_703]|nr:kinase-like domain-containing protein [Xylogone sp. PMI_703]